MNRLAVIALGLAMACEPTDGVRTVTGPRDLEYTAQYGTMNETNSVVGAYGCDIRETAGRCNDYVGTNWTEDLALTQRTCENDNGIFMMDWLCPTGGRLGTCRVDANQPDAFNVTYYIGDIWSEYDGPDRQRACELELGQWVDAP